MRTVFGLALAGLAFGLSARAADHDHEGPHKGVVVEWGDEEFHPEIVVDRAAGAVTVYVYGTDKDLHKGKAAPIDAKSLTLTLKTTPPTVVKLDPVPEKTDPAGRSSKFVGKSDVLKQDAKWAGTLTGKVGTKPYSGDFKQK